MSLKSTRGTKEPGRLEKDPTANGLAMTDQAPPPICPRNSASSETLPAGAVAASGNDWVSPFGLNKKVAFGRTIQTLVSVRRREIKVWNARRTASYCEKMTFDRFNPLTMLMAPDHNPFFIRDRGSTDRAPHVSMIQVWEIATGHLKRTIDSPEDGVGSGGFVVRLTGRSSSGSY